MSVMDVLIARRTEILAVAERYGAGNLRVFGSVARGESDEQSDVDFLVDMAPDRSLLDLGGLVMELRSLLGRPVDVVTESGLRDRVRERVARDVIPL